MSQCVPKCTQNTQEPDPKKIDYLFVFFFGSPNLNMGDCEVRVYGSEEILDGPETTL